MLEIRLGLARNFEVPTEISHTCCKPLGPHETERTRPEAIEPRTARVSDSRADALRQQTADREFEYRLQWPPPPQIPLRRRWRSQRRTTLKTSATTQRSSCAESASAPEWRDGRCATPAPAKALSGTSTTSASSSGSPPAANAAARSGCYLLASSAPPRVSSIASAMPPSCLLPWLPTL